MLGLLEHVALVRSINSVVAKMRKALFYKGFAKIQKFRKAVKSLKNRFCPHFVHIICGHIKKAIYVYKIRGK